MRTSGVSCVTKDWIASLRGTLGGRFDLRSWTRSIVEGAARGHLR
jgi:hypothetical protein